MKELDRIIRTVAPKNITVSLSGESGTGKEVVARRVHELSGRRAAPFVPINCAAIPEPLFESELFGHERGAFTGATERATGKLEAAANGTLFLDEIAEMPLSVQAKLLRFLENRKFMRVGGAVKVSVDIRLITATLRPLEDEVAAGRFRADLFYRIQGIMLDVPPLRERRSDIVPLIEQFIALGAAKHETALPKLSDEVMATFLAYDWPGNVRELRNCIEVLCVLCEGKVVRQRDLPRSFQRSPSRSPSSPPSSSREPHVLEVRSDRPLRESVERIVKAALRAEDGNRSRAARRLGISLRTMQRQAQKLDA
jgi:DNA-binding NtrC family response regulator